MLAKMELSTLLINFLSLLFIFAHLIPLLFLRNFNAA